MSTTTAPPSRLQRRLARETSAEVRFDDGYRWLYATDASLYQVEPIGVVVPRTRADLAAAVAIAAEEGVPIVPRGGATSLSGQTIGEAVILDCSKYLNRVGVVDRDRMAVSAEPGVVLDQLNAHLRPLGLMFGPDVSTSDRATIGGMIGNNSAGARSLRYGKMVDHVRALDVVLDDGTTATFGPVAPERLDEACGGTDRAARLHRAVREVVGSHREAIVRKFPHILRRVSGYNLDEFIPGLPVRPDGWPDEPWAFNLARLVVGSEGTLAVVAGAELKVVPTPTAQGLVILSFATIPAALERLAEIVATGPVAVEMLDRMILDLAAGNPDYARRLDFAEGRPAPATWPGCSKGAPASWASARASRPPRRTTSGRSARPACRFSWAWSATPSPWRSSRTRPSRPTGSPPSTNASSPSWRGTGRRGRATAMPTSDASTSARFWT
jgi:FAD/FMN-containing dehydrogenase